MRLEGASCPVCHRGTIHNVARQGRKEDFHGEKGLLIPADIVIPECDACHESWFDDALGRQIDAALWAAWRARKALQAPRQQVANPADTKTVKPRKQ